VSRARAATGWMVTPIQAILGRRGPIRYHFYFGAAGIAFGVVVGIVPGIKIGRVFGSRTQRADEPAGGSPTSAGSSRTGMRSGRPYRPQRVAHPAAIRTATHDSTPSPLPATDR
jgi:hypothetical protein